MKDEIKERVSYLREWMKLSDKEAKTAARFIMKHRKCRSPIQNTLAHVQYVISFSETSIGSFVKIQCNKCHKEKDISDEVRSNW